MGCPLLPRHRQQVKIVWTQLLGTGPMVMKSWGSMEVLHGASLERRLVHAEAGRQVDDDFGGDGDGVRDDDDDRGAEVASMSGSKRVERIA